MLIKAYVTVLICRLLSVVSNDFVQAVLKGFEVDLNDGNLLALQYRTFVREHLTLGSKTQQKAEKVL